MYTKEEVISRARRQLSQEFPFLGFLLFQVPIHIKDSTEIDPSTIGYTDGKNIYIHEYYAKNEKIKTLKFLLAHEAGHIVFKSFLRQGHRNHILWNMASDYVINGMLMDADPQQQYLTPPMEMPNGQKTGGVLYDVKYKGWTTEAVYEELLEHCNSACKQAMSATGEEQDGEGQGQGRSNKSGHKSKSSKSNGASSPQIAQQSSEKNGYLIDPNTAVNPEDAPNSNLEDDINTILSQAAYKAVEARRRGEGCGNAAGLFMEEIDVALSKRVSWRQLLHKTLRTLGFEQADYSRPSRRTIVNRSLGCNYYFPKLRGSTPGDILMFVDTSGSVSTRSLEVFLGEINNCLRGMPKTSVYLYSVDINPKYEGKFNAKLPTQLPIHGRGGTSFQEAFTEATRLLKQGKKFSTLVYFTDGECSYPDLKTKHLPYDVIWCIDNYRAEKPPFGKDIRIDVND